MNERQLCIGIAVLVRNSTPKLSRHFSPFHGATGSTSVKIWAHRFVSLTLGMCGVEGFCWHTIFFH